MLYAGEATSAKYYGYLHWPYVEGKAARHKVAAYLKDQGQLGRQVKATSQNIMTSNYWVELQKCQSWQLICDYSSSAVIEVTAQICREY